MEARQGIKQAGQCVSCGAAYASRKGYQPSSRHPFLGQCVGFQLAHWPLMVTVSLHALVALGTTGLVGRGAQWWGFGQAGIPPVCCLACSALFQAGHCTIPLHQCPEEWCHLDKFEQAPFLGLLTLTRTFSLPSAAAPGVHSCTHLTATCVPPRLCFCCLADACPLACPPLPPCRRPQR